jgi:hypothetical protein
MISALGYPKSLIAVEKKVGSRRFDLVCYTKDGDPLLLVECKAEEANEVAENQALGYNSMLAAPFICIACRTGVKTLWQEKGKTVLIPFLPPYDQLLYAFSKRS